MSGIDCFYKKGDLKKGLTKKKRNDYIYVDIIYVDCMKVSVGMKDIELKILIGLHRNVSNIDKGLQC